METGLSAPKTWSGQAGIGVGIGVFAGQAGDNREHAHWAHQLSLGLEDSLVVSAGGRDYRAPALFIRAGTPHRLQPGVVCSVYLDPTSAVARELCLRLSSDAAIAAVPADVMKLLERSFAPPCRIDEGLQRFQQAVLGASAPDTPPPLLETVLARLQQGLEDMHLPDRRELAQLAGLSESRFSHWFCEHTGMPFRSYRKWLRLIHGLQQVLNGQPLTAAAHRAQFADQAHFTRTFIQMFGIRPSDLLAPPRSGTPDA